MSVDLARLKTVMENRIHSSGEDFDFVFYSSVNDVIRDLNLETALDVTLIEEDGTDTEVDLDDKYTPVIRDGVQYYMQKNATWARSGDAISDMDYRRSMRVAMGIALVDEDPATGLDYEDE